MIWRGLGVGLGLGLALACGGGSPGPDAAPPATPAVPATSAAPALLHPTTVDGRCQVISPEGAALVDLPEACPSGWILTVNPTDPSDLIITLDERVPHRGGVPLPPLPPEVGELDAVVFEGSDPVAHWLVGEAEVEVAEDGTEGWVQIGDERVRIPHYDELAGVVLCEAWALVDGAWVRRGPQRAVSLHEDSLRPWCARGGGQLDPLGGRLGIEEDWEPPASFEAYAVGEDASWYKARMLPLAFPADLVGEEGVQRTPVLGLRDGAWVKLEGLGEDGQLVSLEASGDHLAACTATHGAVYDLAHGVQKVWEGPPPCPAFWPVRPR